MGMVDEKQNGAESGMRGRFAQAALAMGYEFIAAILLFAGGGYFIDSRRGGGSLFTLIGVALAFGYGTYVVWKMVRLSNDEESSSPNANPHEPPNTDPGSRKR